MKYIVLLLFCFPIHVFSQAAAPSNLSKGIVAYYPFDGDVTDYSGNCLHGVNYNATFTSGRNEDSQGAIAFDGIQSYVEVGHNELFNFEKDESFALSFWLKIPDEQADIDTLDNDIISKWVDENESFEFMKTGYPFVVRLKNQRRKKLKNKIYAAQFSGYKRGCQDAVNLNAKSTTPLNEFVHYLLNVSNGQYVFYENGEVIARVNKQINCSAANTAPLRIGMRGGPMHSNFFKGSIDDLIIYNRGLSKSEIIKLASGQYDIKAKMEFNTDYSTVVKADTIFFEDNVFELNIAQENDLSAIAEYLSQGESFHLVLEGHTNDIPDTDFCDRLSLKRAKVLEKYLLENGVQCQKITTKGLGKRYPMATNKTERGRKLNQRAVIKLYKLKRP